MRKFLFFTILMFLMTGCCSFNREWKAALAQPHSGSDIAGAWEGRWLSERNGHTGKLRGVLTKAGPDEYDAHFRATFWKIFRASYRVPLKYEERNGEFFLTGQADLGKLSGGVYTYKAKATPEHFVSSYESKYDHGTFDMQRPPAKK